MSDLGDADTQIWEGKNFICGIIEEGSCSQEQYMVFKKTHKTVTLSSLSNLCLNQLQVVGSCLGLKSVYR